MTSSAQPQPYSPERRMLIDGELVAAAGGREFDNINPATEEVLGQVADGTSADMHRAIDGARRAFDETDWSTDHELRKHCLSRVSHAVETQLSKSAISIIEGP